MNPTIGYLSAFLLFIQLSSVESFSQRTCVVATTTEQRSLMTETVTNAVAPDIITIPVVVHILYQTSEQNISNEQVKSQIAVLNQDFRLKNADAAFIPAAFKALAADTRIEFRLATVDPMGLPTTGIIRKKTAVAGFGIDDQIKFTAKGGDDAWSRNEYLNIWVGNLSGGAMGYASLPGCAPENDGVVIRYSAFGTTANVQAPFNKGRTTVHEIGHWLGLRHIWGDEACGDDRIDDTPPQAGPTRGCPSGVVSTCTSGAAGNMYMNFMDFTNDECTSMFTAGQAARMRDLFNGGGARLALLSSNKAEGEAIEEMATATRNNSIAIYPNPVADVMNVTLQDERNGTFLTIYNHLGQAAKRMVVSKRSMQIGTKDLAAGTYFISTGNGHSKMFIKR